MKKIISCLILCAMLLTLFPMSVFAVTETSTYSEADISWYSPDKTEYTISTANELAGFNQLMTTSSNFASTATKQYTVTLAEGVTFDLTGYEWKQGTVFNGTFDGNGCTIKNMTVKVGANVAGMFSYAAGTIKNFTLENVTVSNSSYDQLGAVVGSRHQANTGATALLIDGVTVTGATISGKATIGGIIGSTNNKVDAASPSEALTVENCSFNGTVTGTGDKVGGIVGYGVNCPQITIDNCQVDATVSGGAKYTGGVIGHTKVKTGITGTVVSGSVTGSNSHVGGMAGFVEIEKLTVKNCIVTANVTSLYTATGTNTVEVYAGGIVGESAVDTDILNCSVVADVVGATNGRFIGGVVGYYTGGTLKIEGTSFVGTITNRNNGGGGLIGYLYGATSAITVDIDKCAVKATFNGAGNHKGGLIGRSASAKNNITINIDDCIVSGQLTVPSGSTYAAGIVGWAHDNTVGKTTSLTCNNVIVALNVTHNTTQNVFNVFVSTQTKDTGSSYSFSNLYYDSTLMSNEKIAGQFSESAGAVAATAWSAKSTDALKSLSLTGWSTVKDNYPIPSALNGTAVYGHQKSDVVADTIDYRIVGGLTTSDLSTVEDIGFFVTLSDGNNTVTQKVSCKAVYSSVIGGGITYKKGIGTDTDTVEYIGGDYLYVLLVDDIDTDITLNAKLIPYSVDNEGTLSLGLAKEITLKP